MSVTSLTASSALTLSSAIFCLNAPDISGSDKTIKCASKTCASSAPKFFSALRLIISTSALAAFKASSTRACSAVTSVIVVFVKDKSGSTNK